MEVNHLTEPLLEVTVRRRDRSALVLLFLWVLGSGAAAAGGFPADQPYASYWFPNELLSWSPALDPDAPFNRSNVPLRGRFRNPATQVNGNARPDEALVTAVSIMYPSTSFNPSQGYLTSTSSPSTTGSTSTSWCSGAAPPARASSWRPTRG